VSAKFQLIAAEKADPASPYPVVRMCAWLGVSSSGFYDWSGGQVSTRERRRAKISEHVRAAFEAGRGTYGVRRVHALLTRSDDTEVATASPGLVRAIMRQHGLRACQPRAYKATTVRDPGATAAIADHLGRDFTAAAPGCRLVGDITYIPTWSGWLYLATVIDCHTKAVIGWSMAEHMRTDLICEAITMAATTTDFRPGVIFHSDRGTQYTSVRFAEHLAALGVTASMGRTGVCWDNAMAESFFGALKNELVHRTVFPTRERARTAIAEYIEVFYNRQRLHSGIGYKTPAEAADQSRQNNSLAA
jgi:putative transposase